ncbi:MAG TPA: RDD family protein [Candidatus Nitrosotalea sp.]|nr:RDD family protein [Candidatus Nitrosotalea sp.]
MSGLRPAARWRLLAAALTDAALGMMLWALATMWLLVAVLPGRRHPLDALDIGLLAVGVLLLGVMLHVVYHTVLVGGCGQTLGKMLLGVAVVRRDGQPAGYGRALLRVLGGGLCLFTLGLGRLPVLFTRERRGLSDVVAGTRPVSVSTS